MCVVTYLREDEAGECSGKNAGTVAGESFSGGGDGDAPGLRAAKIADDRTELLRLTNVLFVTMRHVLRELRVVGRCRLTLSISR